MGERLIITKLSDLDKISQITRILVQIPHLTSGVVQNQLRKLPWLIPEINDDALMDSIQSKLEILGCTVVKQYIEKKPSEKPAVLESKVIKKTVPDVNSPVKRRGPDKPPPVQASSVSAPRATPKKASKLWLGILLLLLGGGGSYIIYDIKNEADRFPLQKKLSKNGIQKNSIKRQDYPKHDIQRKDGGSSKAKNGQAPKQHKGLLEKAISTSQQISLSFFKRALKETQWNKKERLLEKSTQANRYNSRAWSEWVSSLRKRDEGKKAAVVQKRAYAMNDKTRLVLKSISEKFGTPLQPFDLSEEQFNIQLVIEETQENQIKEKALNFYKALEDIHGDKRLTVLFQNDHKIFELDVPPGKGALTPERIQHFLHEVE